MWSRSSIGFSRKQGISTYVLYAQTILLLALTLFPVLWLIHLSLKVESEAFRMPPQLIFWPTLENYIALFQGKFARSFGKQPDRQRGDHPDLAGPRVPAAYALSRAGFQADKGIALWVLTTRMAPPIAFAIPFFLTYRYLGLIDTLLGLMIIYLTFNLSLVIWMMRTFFDGLPRSLEEAAEIDGAGPWGRSSGSPCPRRARPGHHGDLLLSLCLERFFFALVLTRSRAQMAPVAIVNFMNYEGWEWGKIAAGGTLIMLPVVIFSLLVRRYLIRGLTAGAIKG